MLDRHVVATKMRSGPHRILWRLGFSRESSHEQEAKQVFSGSPGAPIRLVREQPSEHPSMWAAAESIAPMISSTPQTLLDWVKREEVDRGERDGVSTDERECIKALEPKSRNCAVPTRSSSWRVRFSPRWRSTADSSPEGLRRSASRHLWGRADLQGFADCDVGLLTPCCAASRSVQTLRPRQTR